MRRMFKLGKLSIFFWVSLRAVQGATAPPEAVADWCGKLSHELRSVNYQRCAGQPWKAEASSALGHPIPYLEWGSAEGSTAPSGARRISPSSPAPAESGEMRRILVLGAIHGDEISAVSTVFRWIDFLGRTKQDSFLRQNRYLFFPLVNPDGFYATPRTRTNKSGVDLNRNFSTREWGRQAVAFWKRKAGGDPRRFPGKKPGSEPETRAVEAAIERFQPDLIISVHAPYRLVDHDGPILFPDLKSPLPIRTLGAYPGSLGTYAGIERSIPVVTPELPSATQLPETKALEQLFVFIMKSRF